MKPLYFQSNPLAQCRARSIHFIKENFERMKIKILYLSLYFVCQGLCMDLHSQIVITFNALQPSVLIAYAGNNIYVSKGQTIDLNGSVSGGSGNYTYSWAPTTRLSSSTVINPTLIVGNTTVYTLTVTDSHGCLASDEVTISAGSTSVSNVSVDNIVVFPNPTKDCAVVELPASESDYTLTLLTFDGKSLWNKQITASESSVKQTIDLGSMASGMYLLLIRNRDNVWEQKIVKK